MFLEFGLPVIALSDQLKNVVLTGDGGNGFSYIMIIKTAVSRVLLLSPLILQC